MQTLLTTAEHQGYVKDDDEILEKFELDKLCGYRGRNLTYGENIVCKNKSKDDIISEARSCYMNETLIPEIERIYKGRKVSGVVGHPVHYIVETDNTDTRRNAYKCILDALYANKRLVNERYSYLDFRPGENFSRASFETLYRISRGGAIVIRYIANDDSEECDTASSEQETIESICEIARRYKNKVLTVICLQMDCRKSKTQFYENLGRMSFVEVREDCLAVECAKDFLSSLAKENCVRTDKKLFSRLEAEKQYYAAELRALFDEWYDVKLKKTVYPQYKDVSVAQKEVVKAKPRGSAYDELFGMIGLNEAKQVINKAISYYKVQKLYEERGVRQENPSMHMVFSGNPGTAKTTVARLFARIMRENGILSKGHLVEVGRADLVGKYVGWTAPLVKQKFRAASGGVLFIDEAYSLVDGREGMYGDEAINTIVQEMENHREDMIVIFAGYPDKMEGFLEKNPGLRSRIAFHVPFTDYNTDELCRIARFISKNNGMRIDDEALYKLEKVFESARGEKDFGNGRFVRNIFEQAKMNQAIRLCEKDFDTIESDDVLTITADDIVVSEFMGRNKPKIGFC